jgi:hypothetical protein
MSRPKSGDAFVLSPASDQSHPSDDVWEMRVPKTQEVVDCSEFKVWGALGMDAIRIRRRQAASLSTLVCARQELRDIFKLLLEFCDDAKCPRPTTADQLTAPIVAGTLKLIETKESWSAETRALIGNEASRLFRKIVRFGVSVPRVRAPHARSINPRTISSVDAEAIFAAARADIFRIRDRILTAEAAFAVTKVVPPLSVKMSKEAIFAFWVTKMKGIPQTLAMILKTKGGYFFHTKILSHGMNIFDMNRMLYPSLVDSVPFILLLTGKYGLNVRGALDLKTNSLHNGILTVVKKRGDGSDKHIELSEFEVREVKEIIDIWLKISRRGRALLKKEDKIWLWTVLLGKHMGKGLIIPWRYSIDHQRALHRVTRDWCDDRGIARDVGGALMGKLRKHAGSVVYKAAVAVKGSISRQIDALNEVTDFLQHEGDTPACYLLSLITDDEVALAINASDRRLQTRLQAHGVVAL